MVLGLHVGFGQTDKSPEDNLHWITLFVATINELMMD